VAGGSIKSGEMYERFDHGQHGVVVRIVTFSVWALVIGARHALLVLVVKEIPIGSSLHLLPFFNW